jgi:PCI domain
MRLDVLASLVPFADLGEVEQLIVDAASAGYIVARIDHKNGTLRFGAEGLEGDRVRDHIASLAKRLTRALGMLRSERSSDKENRRLKVRRGALPNPLFPRKRTAAGCRVGRELESPSPRALGWLHLSGCAACDAGRAACPAGL